MFGYVRTASEELKVKEYARYKAYYCGICRGMSQYTFIGRALLSYDIAFYALLTDPEAKADIKVKRCKWNLKKKPYACGEALDYAAALNVLLSCGKLRDDISDGQKSRSAALLLLNKAEFNARSKTVLAGDIIESGLKKLSELEQAGCSRLDEAAHEFADMCGRLAAEAPLINTQELKRIVYEIAYNTARWVYIIDAYDDMEQDERRGNYNPIAAESKRRGISEDEIPEWIKDTLFCSLYTASRACELLPSCANTPIISNIIRYGMHDKTIAILKTREEKDGSIQGFGRK